MVQEDDETIIQDEMIRVFNAFIDNLKKVSSRAIDIDTINVGLEFVRIYMDHVYQPTGD